MIKVDHRFHGTTQKPSGVGWFKCQTPYDFCGGYCFYINPIENKIFVYAEGDVYETSCDTDEEFVDAFNGHINFYSKELTVDILYDADEVATAKLVRLGYEDILV